MLIGSDWTNVLSPLNVNADQEGFVSPIDVLLIVNELNSSLVRDPATGKLPPVNGLPNGSPPPFYDSNCDGFVTAIDALLVINLLNGGASNPAWSFSQVGGLTGQAGNVVAEACSPRLREGTSFVSSLTSKLTLPANATALSFQYEALNFDRTSDGTILDAFEAALIDDRGNPVVTTTGRGHDAFFNVTEGLNSLAAADASISNATATSGKVTLSLVGIPRESNVRLVVRLVNNDGDTSSSVVLSSLRFESTGQPPQVAPLISSLAPFASLTPGASSTMPVDTYQSTPHQDSTLPLPGSIPGRIPNSNGATDGIRSDSSSNTEAPSGTQASGQASGQSVIDSRGKEFWIGFPDNLFEGNNRPQKALYISGDIATTGVVDIPGLVDPATSQAFRKAFVVNPGEVTVVELPSLDVGDNVDEDTDFDVEAELIARVQRKGIHVVAQDPVTVYGLDLAVSTSDAFLALPVNSLGKEYINLGYENTFASIAHVEGTQFLVVATQDDTRVTLGPGQYSGSTTASNVRILRPNGTSEFNLGNSDGRDIGPFVTDAAGTGSFVVTPPFDGYSGAFDFELIDVATAAVAANLDEKITVNFPTGRESRVFSFDVVAGQRLYYDAINPSPAPNVSIHLLSPSGVQGALATQNDNNAVANLFGALQFTETGKYYVLITGEQATAFDFSFRLIDMDVAPRITFGTDVSGSSTPAGRAEIYRMDGNAGQVLYYDALNQDRNVGFTVYGAGGQQVFGTTASDDRVFVLPETGTYIIVLDSASFVPSSFAFRILDLKSAPTLTFTGPTTTDVSTGHLTSYRFSAAAAQTFSFDIQSVSPFFRVTYQLFDSAGNPYTLSESGNNRSVRLMTSGAYTLLIGALTVQEGGSVTILPNLVDDPIVAKSGFNTSQTLTIAAGESATYSFTAPAGTRVLVDSLNAATSNLNVEINAPDGTRLFTGFGLASDTQDIPRFGPSFLPQSGTYKLTLRGNAPSAAGSYSFRILDLDTIGVPLTLGTVVNGNFPSGREALVYTFDATAGEKLLFDGMSGAFIFGVYNHTLNADYSRGIFGAASTAEVDGIARIVQSGRHYVLFQGDATIPRDFSFKIHNLSLAPRLAIGEEASGTVDANSQVTYRMALTAGQRIRLDTLLPNNSNVNFRIANSGGRFLFDSGFQSIDSDPPGNRPLVVAESGEYLVSIQSRQAAPASFRFRIDDLALAQVLSFDTDLQVVLNPGSAARVFRIDATAGETIQLDNADSFLNLNWGITGPLSQFVGGSNDGADFSGRILSSGTHFLTISGRQDSGPITLRFRATRTPGPLVSLTGFNTPVNLDVGINETRNYSFSAPTGRLVYLNVRQSEFAIPTHTVTLNQGETYLLRDLASGTFSGAADLTGSIITSTKPVAVFGGNRATFIPSQFFAADHLVEQLPPTNTWGREFATMPLVTGSTRGELFRFLAQTDDTQLTVNGTVVATLQRGQFHQQVLVGPGHVVANKPILVAQYAHSQNFYRTDPGGNASFLGDPLMMVVPPVEQFLANYTVSTPAVSSILNAQRFDRNFINIVAPQEAVGLIEVDGVAIAANKFVAIGTSGHFGTQVPVDLGSYQLAGPMPFGVFVYGFGSFDSYGYVGGQSLSSVATATSVQLSPGQAAQQVNTAQSFFAIVNDAGGRPLEGIRVDFSVAGVNPKRAFAFTDAQGRAEFGYTGTVLGRDIVTAAVGQLTDDSIVDWNSGAAPPTIAIFAPGDGSSVVAGTTLVATGAAFADRPRASIDLVLVNGVPIDGLDATGNFFVPLFVGPGLNEYEFTVIDSANQTQSQIITLRGEQPRVGETIDLSRLSDVSSSFKINYSRTTYNADTRSLFAETAVENVGQYPADVPLLVGITNISDPRVIVRGADGRTPDGVPYYDFSGKVAGRSLSPQATSNILTAQFYNPNEIQFTYDLVFLGQLNQAPQFTSIPPFEAIIGKSFEYKSHAVDSNGDALSYLLLENPPSMTIDATSGLVAWTPTTNDIGSHTIEIQVSDGRNGVTVQRFTLDVDASRPNRAPVFTSSPSVFAEVGVDYSYTARASDADENPLTYAVISGPSGYSIHALSGAVTWIPTLNQLGNHEVVIEVSDGAGGSARQSFHLCVVSPMDNHRPIIVSTPPRAAVVGAFTYELSTIDADNEALNYRLLVAPTGMTIHPSNGIISWNTSVANVGSHTIRVAVSDARGAEDQQAFDLGIFQNSHPTITSQPPLSARMGDTYRYQVSVVDNEDDLLSYELLNAPVGMSIHPSSGLVEWRIAEAYERESVSLRVVDGRGGIRVQQFSIAVSGGRSLSANAAPIFTSRPSAQASEGIPWLYSVAARDPNGDVMSFDLPLAPSGMSIQTSSGQIAWQPRSEQTGVQQVVVRVTDTQGGVATQSFEILVTSANTAPIVTSVPPTQAVVGKPWQYRVKAQDAEQLTTMVRLASSVPGMSISLLSGQDADAVVSFTPTNPGQVPVSLIVDDGIGGLAEQAFSIAVVASADNHAPIFTSKPRVQIPFGQRWIYLLGTDDVDADPLDIKLVMGPTGMVLDAEARILDWTPTSSQTGSHSVTLSLSDGRGGSVEQQFSIAVVAINNNTTPEIQSPPSAYNVSSGEIFSYDLLADDKDIDPVQWRLTEAPTGASVDPRNGTLRWRPSQYQLGAHRFIVEASDPLGQIARQSFTVFVSCANLPPSILSRPPAEASVGERYVYGVRAIDPENDALHFALTTGPSGMTIDSLLGIVRWTPTVSQLGTNPVSITVTDRAGNFSSQIFSIVATQAVRNQDPVITSRAAFRAIVGSPYSYDVNAFDPDGVSISYALLASPSGMQIDANTGAISWTPGATQAGSHLVQVAALDTEGGRAVQRFAILARTNQAPTITSSPVTTVSLGAGYAYDVQVNDPERDAVRYELVAGPLGMTMDGMGRLQWKTLPGVPNSNPVTVRVTDAHGASVQQSFTLLVTPDQTTPKVQLLVSHKSLKIGEDAVIVLRATDDVGVVDSVLTFDGRPQTLDANHSLTIRGTTSGLYALRATARDASGNVGSFETTLRVFDPSDTLGPAITITSPGDGSKVTKLVDIVGSVTDDNLQSYQVEYGRADLVDINDPLADDPDYRTIVTSSSQAIDRVLGKFDPTILQNDDYVIRILARDLNGNTSSKTLSLSLDGQLKLGEFSFDNTDLSVPLAGIPISIVRTYSTHNAGESGDFGFGWTLGIQDGQIRESIPVNALEGQDLTFAATPFRDGTRVYITNPEGRRVGFTFRPRAQFSLFGGGSFLPAFVPDPGVYDSLDAGSVPLRRIGGAFYSAFFGDPFNPSAYRLTTKDGTIYEHHQFSGLDNVHDRQGNRLQFRSDGIFSSGGPSVQFVRDPKGRISRIIDPAGNATQYRYDAVGNLIQVTDALGATTRYGYLTAQQHFLSAITDPAGNQTFSASFDASGRLVSSSNNVGATIQNQFDLATLIETTTDALGNVNVVRFDDRGNVVHVTRPGGGIVQLAYDANDNQTTVTDENGNRVVQSYDAQGNLTTVTDPLGNSYHSTYNSFGQLTSTTGPTGLRNTMVYDENGNLIQFINVLGQSTTATFDDKGRATSYTDGRGFTTNIEYGNDARASRRTQPIASGLRVALSAPSRNYQYNSLGQVIRETDENGNVTVNTYDAVGRPVSSTDALGNSYRYEYVGQQMIAAIDPLGRKTRFEYDKNGRRVRTINPAGGVNELTYDANNQVTQVTDPLGRKTSYLFNSDGRVASETDALGNTKRFEYDAAGNRTTVIDELGNRWSYQYDQLGRIVTETNPLGGITRWTFDSNGNRTSSTDARGNKTEYLYDALNRLIAVIDALGNRFSADYDANGNIVRFTNPKGQSSTFEYDAVDRMISATNADGFVRKQSYDPVGNRIRYVDESGAQTDYAYDAANRVVSETNANGGKVERTLDAYGNTVQFRDELGNTIALSFDQLNLLTTVANSDGRSVHYTYDAVGNRTSVVDPLRHTTRFQYDALDRVIRETDPLGGVSTTVYDAVGNVSSRIDRNGRTIAYRYDGLGREIQEQWLNGSSLVNTIDVSYDAVGNLLSVDDTRSSLEFSYDSLNRLATQDNAGTAGVPRMILTHQSDALGNLMSVSDNFGTLFTRSINSRNQNSSSTLSGGGVSPSRIDFSYNARGQRQSAIRYSDLDATQRVGRSSWTYGALGEVSELKHFDAIDAVIADYDYVYDKALQVKEEGTATGTTAYSYDAARQLLAADRSSGVDEQFTYDANGNRVGSGTQIGPGNRLLQDARFSYGYDPDGNLIRRSELSSGNVTTFTYDHRNRLTDVELRTSSSTLLSQSHYTYDGLDRRILVDVNGTKTSTVYLGNSPWADFDASGSLIAKYMPGEAVDELMARHRPGEGTTWYLADRLGSVRDLADQTGAVVDRIVYGSFGEVLTESNPSIGDRFKFTGREWNAETGLYYNRARYYDPSNGRFLSDDPLGFAGGDTNLQRYVGNNPVNATDPTGLQAIAETGGLFAFVSVYASVATTYGADVPFTLRIGCKDGACGISGSVTGSNISIGGLPSGPFSFGGGIKDNGNGTGSFTWNAGVSGGPGKGFTSGIQGELRYGPPAGGGSNQFSPGNTFLTFGLSGPPTPGLNNDPLKAQIPSLPYVPSDSEFSFLVITTAQSPHLVISADIAMFVTAGEVLALVARAAVAENWETSVEVFYEAKTENPKASVKSHGFADLTPRFDSSGNNGPPTPPPQGGPKTPPPPVDPTDEEQDDDGDDGDDGDGGSDEPPMIFGNGGFAAIGDSVWFDVDRDGIHDDDEAGVGSVRVQLFTLGQDGQVGGGDDQLAGSQLTDATGFYLFSQLNPGVYYIAYDLATIPVGFKPTRRNVGDDAYDSDADEQGRDDPTQLDPGEVDLTHDMGIVSNA